MTPEARPDPDELLARIQPPRAEGRGSMRVFLGAAPGVGKSYTMLREGHRLLDAGHDVVVGLVETHGRSETEAQIGSLPVVPRKVVSHRGVTLEEMDTEAILERQPEYVLVDELAHTNAPGSKHLKRWQDVEELRNAGIHVLTTVNIQHLESLNDLVQSITGVQVNETLPDQVLDAANEVQLVDLPVESLIERMEQGHIYGPDMAKRALENFFRPGNLAALREFSLRHTAAGVDEQLEHYMRAQGIAEVWPAADRVMAMITPEAADRSIIRSAWRLADGYHAELMVAILLPASDSPLAGEQQHSIQRATELAEDLGATIVVKETSSLVDEIDALTRDYNITTLVIGYTPLTGWRRLKGPSLVDQLLERLEDVIIQVERPS